MDAGLASLIETAPVDELLKAMRRMAHLPEFGMHARIAALNVIVEDIGRHEQYLAQARERLREEAKGLLKAAAENWSGAEIETATGYRP